MGVHASAALVVLSAFFHAGWNALLHRCKAQAREATFVVLLMSLALSALGSVYFDAAALGQAYQSGWTWLSGISEGIYFLTLGVVMQRLPLGLGYLLMRGISMLLVTALSVVFFAEAIGAIKAMGMFAIAAGVVLRGIQRSSAQQTASSQGIMAAIGCALGITGYHMAYGCALRNGAHALPLFAASLSIAVAINIVVLGPHFAKGAWQSCRQHASILALAAVGCLGAFWLFLSCLGALHAGVAICLRNLSVVFAQLMGWRMGERMTLRASAALCFFMLGGVLLVLAP